MSHEAQDGEDHETREETGDRVGHSNDERVLVTVASELIVRRQSYHTPTGGTKREDDLNNGGEISMLDIVATCLT